MKGDHHHYFVSLFLIPSSQEFDRHKAVICRKITELNVIAAICRPLLVPKHKLWLENNPVTFTATDHFYEKSSGAASASYRYVRQIQVSKIF